MGGIKPQNRRCVALNRFNPEVGDLNHPQKQEICVYQALLSLLIIAQSHYLYRLYEYDKHEIEISPICNPCDDELRPVCTAGSSRYGNAEVGFYDGRPQR